LLGRVREYAPILPRRWAGVRMPIAGVAWVLLAEHRDGYPHRLRAIGHLFEAEDEWQAWPDLHDIIREARRAYQKAGRIPDFDAFAALLAKHRHRA